MYITKEAEERGKALAGSVSLPPGINAQGIRMKFLYAGLEIQVSGERVCIDRCTCGAGMPGEYCPHRIAAAIAVGNLERREWVDAAQSAHLCEFGW